MSKESRSYKQSLHFFERNDTGEWRFKILGVLWILIRMDPHHFGYLDPHPHQIKIRIRIKYKSGSASICRWQAKIYGIWACLSTFSMVWAFIWMLGSGSGSASASNKNPDPHLIKIRVRVRIRIRIRVISGKHVHVQPVFFTLTLEVRTFSVPPMSSLVFWERVPLKLLLPLQSPFGAGVTTPQMNIFAGTSPFAASDFSLAELDPLKKWYTDSLRNIKGEKTGPLRKEWKRRAEGQPTKFLSLYKIAASAGIIVRLYIQTMWKQP